MDRVKFKVGQNVLIKAVIESIEIKKDCVIYNVLSGPGTIKGIFKEEHIVEDKSHE